MLLIDDQLDTAKLDAALRRLDNAVLNNRSTSYCHRLWSQFIRLRDLHRCVVCDSPHRVSAHHILRKSFLATLYPMHNSAASYVTSTIF